MTTAVEQFSQAARSPATRDFAASLTAMQDQLAKLTAGDRVAQFGFSSIEDDYIPVYDALGQVRQQIGRQSDGTFAVTYKNGTPPPVPAGIIVTARQIGVYVAWDGTWAGGYSRPSDVVRLDVHLSNVAGFVPDGTTVVGNIPFAGGVLIGGLANETKYVKVVAVTTSSVASAPTPETPTLPLPVSQLAIGSVGANQIATNVLLASRFIAGDPAAARLEIEGRTGMPPGMKLYDASGSPTLSLDALTGNVSMRGTLRTAESGERIVIREQSNTNDIRFYPVTGNAYASLKALPRTYGGADYGGMQLVASYYDGYSTMYVDPQYIYLSRNISSINKAATLWLDYRGAVVEGIALKADVEEVRLSVGTNNMSINNNETQIVHSGLVKVFVGGGWEWRFAQIGNAYQLFVAQTMGTGVYFNTSGILIAAPASGALRAVTASNVAAPSARSTKTAIEALPYDSVTVIQRAAVKMFERKSDEKDDRGRRRKNVGPMADDLPAALQVPVIDGDGTEVAGVDLGNQIGVAWDAIAKIATRLDHLEKVSPISA